MGRMNDRMPVGPALEQLRELIAILRELGNAGPRDNSFKQWRQVTLTLLQRVWAGDPARAVRFRRIPFSAPSARADAKTVRESFVRGVNEAGAYLEGLARELEADVRGPELKLKRPPEIQAPSEFKRVEPYTPPRPAEPPNQPSGPIEPSPWESAPPTGPAAAGDTDSEVDAPPAQDPPQPARKPTALPGGDADKSAARPRQRLKDMLGFSDEAAAAPLAPAKSPAPVSPAASRPPAAAPPAPAPPLNLVPDPPPSAPESAHEEFDFDFDFTDLAAPEVEAESEVEPEVVPAPTTLREMIDRTSSPGAAAPNGAAGEVLAMAAKLDQLGVPKLRRAMVRAALLDLAEQLEAPPVDWVAIRQAFAFVLDYPQVARRVIPMLVPYLDEAA